MIKPHDGNTATVGNGVMIALVVDSKREGGRPPRQGHSSWAAPTRERRGPRGDRASTPGYFRDLDGNKLNAFCMT